jgi:DNA-binding response OmpR family regulator
MTPSRRILLVEDCPEVRDLAALCLRHGGWEVLTAGTLAQARDYSNESIDAVLTDLELPDGLGTTLTSIFGSPLILFSAKPPDQLPEGFHGSIKKPFDPSGLSHQIAVILEIPPA